MGIIKKITPTNLFQEYERFREDSAYNPVFTYEASFKQSELTEWGTPSKNLGEFAKEMSQRLLTEQQSRTRVAVATQDEVTASVEKFLTLLPQLSVELNFSTKLVSRCRVSGQKLVLREPIVYKSDELVGMVYHEIGTHMLRSYNHKNQNWSATNAFGTSYRFTEEGLAILHTYLGSPNSSLFQTYSLYYALYFGFEHSFSETFKALRALGVSEKRSWRLCVRVKRGLTDTSQPGGFSKDITYLEGALRVWKWLADSDHNPHDLYLGNISLDEVVAAKKTALNPSVVPPFMENLDLYREQIATIGEKGQFQHAPQL